MEPFSFEKSETYEWDLELFHKLGLKTFETNNQDQIFVGEYKLQQCEVAKVKIWVTCMPAQFWQFEIETDEGEKFNIGTGSGSLSDYWDSVEKVAEGMFCVNKI